MRNGEKNQPLVTASPIKLEKEMGADTDGWWETIKLFFKKTPEQKELLRAEKEKRDRQIREALRVSPFWPKMAMRITSCGMHHSDARGWGFFGSFLGLVIQYFAWIFELGLAWMIVITLLTFILALIVTEPGERLMLRFYGPRKRHNGEVVEYDFNQDCIDEVVGQLCTGVVIMFIVALKGADLSFWHFVVGFGLFRILDTFKLLPIRFIEGAFRPGSAWGIILDDVASGVLAGLVIGFIEFPLT